jgi:hypothetical protein
LLLLSFQLIASLLDIVDKLLLICEMKVVAEGAQVLCAVLITPEEERVLQKVPFPTYRALDVSLVRMLALLFQWVPGSTASLIEFHVKPGPNSIGPVLFGYGKIGIKLSDLLLQLGDLFALFRVALDLLAVRFDLRLEFLDLIAGHLHAAFLLRLDLPDVLLHLLKLIL